MGQGLKASQVKKSPNAVAAVTSLEASHDKPSKSILRKVNTFEIRLKGDCQCGEVIRKPFPRALITAYDMENLYKIELSDFWRLLYTIERDGNSRYVIILEI